MKRYGWLALLALGIAVPRPLAAQDRVERAAAEAQRAGSGYMGIFFGWDDDASDPEVREVVPGGPADRAGVRQGDIVLRLNGRAATREVVDGLREHLNQGDSVRLRIRRGEREEDRVVVAAARPRRVATTLPRGHGTIVLPDGDRVVIRLDTLSGHLDSLVTRMNGLRGRLRSIGNDSVVVRLDSTLTVYRDGWSRTWPEAATRIRQSLPMLYALGERSIAGADFTEMNAGLGRYFHTNEGVLVLQVAAGTPAARAGLQPGDVVQQANGSRITTVRAFREAFVRADGQEVRLRVLRDGRTQELRVQWEPSRMRSYRYDSNGELQPSTAPRARSRERTRTP